MNNLSPIPFYKSLDEQDFRLWYAYGEKYPFFVPSDYLIPFFFCLPKVTGRTISKVEFFRACCGDEPMTGDGDFNLDFSFDFNVGDGGDNPYLGYLLANGLAIHTIGDYDVVTYPANNVNALNLTYGIYYLKITTSDNVVRYSDIFIVKDISKMMKIEWYCMNNLSFEGGVIPYGDVATYKNVIYLDATIGKPEYKFTEEGEERDGYFFAIKQISEKTFKFGFVAPEWLCDCMRLIRLSDRVKITDKFNSYQCDTFLIEADWTEQGHYANVSCEFDTDTVVKMVGKAYSNIIDR